MSPPIGAPVHFHIRWSGSAGLDFFRFSSREEADESAKMWIRGNEAYSIEEFGDSCERCAALLDKMTKKTRPS